MLSWLAISPFLKMTMETVPLTSYDSVSIFPRNIGVLYSGKKKVLFPKCQKNDISTTVQNEEENWNICYKKVYGHTHKNYRYLPITVTNTSQIIHDEANFDIKYSTVMLLHIQLIPDEWEPPLDTNNSDEEHHPKTGLKLKRPRTRVVSLID